MHCGCNIVRYNKKRKLVNIVIIEDSITYISGYADCFNFKSLNMEKDKE